MHILRWFCYVPIRCSSIFIAHKYLSVTVNVFSSGSPSLMRRVLLISFGMTILPRSSTLRTIPVAFIFSSPYSILLPNNPCCGARHLPWHECLRHLPTTATRSARFFCHRQRSHRSPVAFIYISSPRNVTNYAVSICKTRGFIRTKSMGIWEG